MKYEELLSLMDKDINRYAYKFNYLGYDACEDIKQVARLAVYHAMSKYDESKGNIRALALNWIQSDVNDYVSQFSSAISKSRAVYNKQKLIKDAYANNPCASVEEISKLTGLSHKQVMEYQETKSFVSLDDINPVYKDSNKTYEETISTVEYEDNYDDINLMMNCINKLSKYDQYLLLSSFGINVKRKTHDELAALANVSRQAISKRITKLLQQVKEQMEKENY